MYNQPFLLTDEQRIDLMSVVRDFFSNYHLKEARDLLWNTVKAGFGSDAGEYLESKHRSDVLFFYENVLLLIEATFLLLQMDETRKDHSAGKR